VAGLAEPGRERGQFAQYGRETFGNHDAQATRGTTATTGTTCHDAPAWPAPEYLRQL